MAKLPHTTTKPTTSPVAYHDAPHNSHRDQPTPPSEQRPHARLDGDTRHQIIWQMTHELRIPLTAMMGFAQMLLDPKSSKPLDQQQRSYVAHILDSGEHLLSIINEMLEVATLRAGRAHIERAPLDPRALLSEVRDQLAPLASAKAQHMTLHIRADLPTVNADHQRMRQVLLNLLGNAIKFAPHGSEIILGAQAAEGGATDFFVRNYGPVIPRAYQRTIFQPFAQAPQSTSDTPRGVGLGLTIAQDLVHDHGGMLWVRSNQRHGTTFWVRLPG